MCAIAAIPLPAVGLAMLYLGVVLGIWIRSFWVPDDPR
jgi:hypothetical protein